MIEVAIAHEFQGFDLDIAFSAPAGVTALFGRSGAGKSSVALALAGLFRPRQARLVLGGRVLQQGRHFVPPHRRRIGMVFQDPRLFPHLTVRENLDYARKVGGAKPRIGLEEVARLLGIAALLGRDTAALSGGEAARVALGRALLSDPGALILDEPFAALDAPRRAEILPYLQSLRQAFDLPILFISHSLAEVAQLAGTLVVLEGGRVAAQGPVARVLSDPALVPIFGLAEAGALIQGRVQGREADGLTRVETGGGPVFLPGLSLPPGSELALRVRAQDVMLALAPLAGISALNLLSARVESLAPEGEAGMVVVLSLGAGGERLLARLTRRSALALGLRPGLAVQAILKSVALAG